MGRVVEQVKLCWIRERRASMSHVRNDRLVLYQPAKQWWIATHVEDVSQEELEKRMKARESQ